MSDTDKYAARDALQALLDDYDEQIEVNAQMAEVLRNIRVPLNVPLADYVANTEAPTTSLEITDLASLLADHAAANARIKKLGDGIANAESALAIQGGNGNWNYDAYMHGIYNGMEYVLATATGREPNFKDAPDEWLHEDAARKAVRDDG